MSKTFADFLNKTYTRNTLYIDTDRKNVIVRFEHVPNACRVPCSHMYKGVQCDGTAIKKWYIHESNMYAGAVCSFPNDLGKFQNRFIPLKSSNIRW